MAEVKSDRTWRCYASLRRIPARHLLLLVIASGVLSYLGMMVRPSTSAFNSDSWSYYDLSQTVFADFYHGSVTRAFHEHDGYSRSFPPLWPVLIALANVMLRQGPRTGVVLATLFALLTVIPLKVIAAACVPRSLLASVAAVTAWLGLLWFPPYWEEAFAGCGIPVSVFLLSCAVACLLHNKFFVSWLLAAGVGFSLGLACLARFDSLVFSSIVVLASLVAPGIRIPVKASLVLTFVIAISPWVLYSQKHYGSLWASDNSAVARSASPAYVQDYRLPSDTIATHPVRWARRISMNSVKLVMAVVYAVDVYPVLPLSLAAAVIVWKIGNRRRWVWLHYPANRLSLVLAAAIAGLGGQVLTGYMDRRYFSFFCLLATFWTGAFVLNRTPRVRITVLLALIFQLVLSPFSILEWSRLQFGGGPPRVGLSEDLRNQLLGQYRSATILADSLCYETGAVTRIHTVCLPTDWARLTREQQQEFISSLGITHALVPSPDSEPGHFSIVPARVDLPVRTR